VIDTTAKDYLLPYQKKWILDKSRFKLAEKSRRTGFTYTQSLEDVQDVNSLKLRGQPLKVWFSSSDMSAGPEYIDYCAWWARILNSGFQVFDEMLFDENKDIKVMSIQFNNGGKIHALSSSPKSFRSKGGKVILDEFAFHDDQLKLWKAAKPSATWGYPVRIISTLNGTNNLYYKFLSDIKKGKLSWSLHTVDIFRAVDEGLADKILGRKLTQAERKQWLDEEKASCGDSLTWQEEYCCIPIDKNSSFISYELIDKCCENTLINDLTTCKGELFAGYDVARTKDLSVIAVFEKLGSVFYLRKLIELKNVKFREQKRILYQILSLPNCRKCCIDKTGIGAQMAEDAEIDFGKRKVEPIGFTTQTKEELAYKLYYAFEDYNIRFSDDELIKNDIHSIKKMPTSTGAIRFDAQRSETDGHADRFWAFALAIFAGSNKPYVKPEIISAKINNNKGFNLGFNLRGLGGILRGL